MEEERIGDLRAALPGAQDPRWAVRRRDVRRALELASASAPGPDGVPYSAWQRLGSLAVDLLLAAGSELEQPAVRQRVLDAVGDDEVARHAFNGTLLHCIPKSGASGEAGGATAPLPSETRPL